MSQTAAHLHVHSEYSLLDGANKIEAMAARAAELGQPALGLTDHGVMNGAVELYKACRAQDVKPIMGVEAYLVGELEEIRTKTKWERNHLTLLASNNTGFQNLVKLSSAGFLEGFARGKANVDLAMLERYSEGVIALTGCLQSRFCRRIVEDRPSDARAHADELLQIFGPDNVYFELQVNGIADQDKANEGITRVARELGKPLVGTADVHYLRREDYNNHAALLCVQTKSTLEQPKMSFDTNEFYLKSSEEMVESFQPWPEAVPNSLEIAARCEVEISLGDLLLPKFPTPDGSEPTDMLRRVAGEGLRTRYGDPPPAAAIERLDYELGVIEQMGFPSYFLIVWDFVRYSKENGIAVGPGRGSAAGSIVAYALGITDLDPLANDLLFERFLNPARKSMPDIDIDFSVRGREQVIRYVGEKYGRESVAQIITFGTMAPRAATRDAARVLGFDYGTGDRVAKLIPEPIMGRSPSFEDCLSDGEDLKKAYDTEADTRQIVDTAKGLEGIVRNHSIHAAAVVIADRPLQEVVPLQLAEDRGAAKDGERSYKVVTQYSMNPVEDIGLLKMDFLGLRNLDVIEDAVEIIERSRGEKVDVEALPTDNEATFEMLRRGDSVGVFQLESEGMQDALRKVKPTEFDDIVALVSLYRPGAMRYIDEYARGKRDPQTVRFADERLRPITEATYGCCIYQEQLMEISKQIAGFSGAQADDLRKAIGKKKRDMMATLESKFVEGAAASGTDGRVSRDLWSLMTAAADYSFNKCASADTRVILPDGKRLRLSEAYRLKPESIMSMWPDGEIRPHRVAKIVKTGRKPLFRVRCESGRQIKATAEHRLMTTAGYTPVSEMRVGDELITMPKISERQREARRKTMKRLARQPGRKAQDKRAAERMRAYQASRSYEEKAAHMKRMHEIHPDLTRAGTAAMHERIKWLHANDPEWRRAQMERSLANGRDCYDSGPGFGRCSVASNGMWCASNAERMMCEWLVERGVEFEMHKVLPNGRICDFYFDGIYWEMDGMDRTAEFFAEKYGELPHRVVTPEDFRERISVVLDGELAHAENGDPIVSIEPIGEGPTYDIEMAPDGPLNFMANGIVSHNSHAACYALIAYRTAYLKANYPAEYMAAVISSVMSTKDKVPFFVNRCEEMGIGVLPPDVNSSDHGFIVIGNDIRFGLDAVKNVGHAAVEAIISARDERPFDSLWDFCERVDARAVNKRAIECLIKCGALDSTGAPRKVMLERLPDAQAAGSKSQEDAERGQGSIFALEEAQAPGANARPQHPPLFGEEYEGRELLRLEKETLGTFLSDHPLSEVRDALKVRSDCTLSELDDKSDGTWVTVGGIVSECKKIRTKAGASMMFATLDDLEGRVEMIVFAKTLDKLGELIDADAVLLVRGRVDHKDQGETKIVVQDAELFEPSTEEMEEAKEKVRKMAQRELFRIDLEVGKHGPEIINELKTLLGTFPGEADVLLEIPTSQGPRRLKFGPDYRVRPSAGLRAELAELVGTDSLAA
ncbi:MAG: DNA polymerase III subunit alpha [Solirubrobacterales bacterium]